jgi:outer membrane lipoprotein-sorting protein
MQAYHSQRVPDGPPSEFVAGVVATLRHVEATAPQHVTTKFRGRIRSMRSTSKIAVAAAALIVVGGLLAWLAPGRGTALAFADVAKAFADIRTATCMVSSELEVAEGKKTTSGRSMYMAPSRERSELTGIDGSTTVFIMDRQKGKAISLLPEKKMAMVFQIENVPPDRTVNYIEHVRKLISDARRGQADRVDSLGRQTIDGRELVGFRLRRLDGETNIWAEPETARPVRVEFIHPKTRTVMRDFRINVPMKESLFNMEIPEGYATIAQVSMDGSMPTVKDLARSLGFAAEQNGGVFPAELLGVNGIEGVMFKAVHAKYGPGESSAKLKAITEFSAKLTRGMAFVRDLSRENDMHYAGKGVKLNTPNRPIFWYKPTGKDRYQMIYADLSVKEVAPSELPEDLKSPGGDAPPEEKQND